MTTAHPAPDPAPTHPDLEAFAADLSALRERIDATVSEADFAHLLKLERWGRTCSVLGYATAPLGPNPLSVALLSTGRFARWACLAHPILHKGYDRVPGIPERYTSKGFAKGARRFVDWFDWIPPDAWSHEHNVLHHYHLGEEADPDLLERNVDWLRALKLPRAAKWAIVGVLGATWKWSYYTPNTLLELRAAKRRRQKLPPEDRQVRGKGGGFDPRSPIFRDSLLRGWLPYGLWQFVAVPALFAPLGPLAVASVAINSLAAEALTNLHGFATIGPNHTGDDMVRFDRKVSGKAEFYYRQVIGSVNYDCGGDLNDFLLGWLNYQIEHHVFPDLTLLQYQRVQPEVKALCAKHGIPYAQEHVMKRVKRMLDVMTGHTSMRWEAA